MVTLFLISNAGYRQTKKHWENEILENQRFKWSLLKPTSKIDSFCMKMDVNYELYDDDDYYDDDKNANIIGNHTNSTIPEDISHKDKIQHWKRTNYARFLKKCFAGERGFPFWCSFEGWTLLLLSCLMMAWVSYQIYDKCYYYKYHRYVLIK